MPDTTYRLKTEDGLSEQFTLEHLQEKSSQGEVDDSLQCTPDDGDTWVSLGTLIMNSSALSQRPAAEGELDSDSEGNSASAGSADTSGTNSSDTGTNKASETQSTESAPGLRKLNRLKRLPPGSGNSRFSRPKPEQKEEDSRDPGELVGKTLAGGRYKVLAQFGAGSMAYVFKAADSRLETDVIVKVPKPEKITTADFRERFRRESQLLVRLSHPHVVKVLDVGEYEELPYVVMQLLSGGTLQDRMQKDSNDLNQMSTASLQTWVREVARALDFCFKRGMVHRDVKPANILFDDDDNAYVSDFGLTKIMHGEHTELNSSGTATGVVLGTPNYLSPEIILGAEYDGRSDQYSLGMTVYHALCGRPPMQGKSATATMINQTQKKLELLSSFRKDIPRELALAVRKSIEKDPKDRFATSEEFAEAVLDGLRQNPSAGSQVAVSPPLDASTSSAAMNPSARSKTTRRPAKKKRRVSSESSASGEADWLDPTPTKLPPRKGGRAVDRPGKKSKKSKKSLKPVILGIEVSPAMVAVAAAMIVVPVVILAVALFSDASVEEVAAGTGTDSAPPVTNNTSAESNSDPRPPKKNNRRKNHNSGKASQQSPKNVATNQSGNPGGNNASQKQNPGSNPTTTQTVSMSRGYSSGIQGSTPAVTETPTIPITKSTDSVTKSTDISVETKTDRIVVSDDSTVALTHGPPGCPVIVSGQNVWSVPEKKSTVKLDGEYDSRAQTTLSRDGKFFAAASRPPGQQNTDVIVWDTNTGKKLFTAKGDSKRFVDTILLSSTDLFVGDRWSDELLVWNCPSGKKKKSVRIQEAKFKQGNTAISHDGNYIAAVANNQLGVFKADTGKPLVPMKNPRSRARNAEKSQALYASLQSLGFSPAGDELATISTMSGSRLMCWDGRGNSLIDRVVAQPIPTLSPLQWFPEQKAWLIGTDVFDRDSERIVLSVLQDHELSPRLLVYDDNHICGTFADAPAHVAIAEIPWDEIQKSLARLDNDKAAIIRPESGVSITVRLGIAKNVGRESEATLKKTLRSVLSSRGLRSEEGQKTQFLIRVANDKENPAPILSSQFPSERRTSLTNAGAPGGRQMVMELIGAGVREPVWRVCLGDAKALVEAPDQSKRRELIGAFESAIRAAPIPYYVPKDDSLIALPAVIR